MPSKAAPQDEFPFGMCHCGCGKTTNIAPMTSKRNGVKKGEPYRYVCGHYKRTPKQDYVVGPDSCWIWQGALHRSGYGRTRLNGRIVMAHRAFYEMHRGPIPDGLVIDHPRVIRSVVTELAQRYNVSVRTICGIGEGVSWKDA